MIHLPLSARCKSRWLAAQDAQLRQELAPQLAVLQAACQQQLVELQQQTEQLQGKHRDLQRLHAQVADQESLLADRKVELAKANEECRTQLRLLEAKAAPEGVWVEAFGRGFEKAWEAMWPFLAQGITNSQAVIERQAIDQTLARLEPMIVERAEVLKAIRPREAALLLAKQAEFQQKRQTATTDLERAKYDHYLTALDWMLNADGLRSHQPVP